MVDLWCKSHRDGNSEVLITVQLNLNFTDMCQYTCVPVYSLHVKLKIWHAHAVLYTILACTWLPVNTCDIQVMHFMSLHLVWHTTHVMYRYSRHVQTMKCISFALVCSWAASKSILSLTKYMGVCLFNKYMYNVETSMQSNFYTYSSYLFIKSHCCFIC